MGVALITPFKEDDSVDYDALLRLVDYQLQNGTDFLCVLGTTAETPTLTSEEKLKIKNFDAQAIVDKVLELDATRRAYQTESDALIAQQKGLAAQIGAFMKNGQKAEAEQEAYNH